MPRRKSSRILANSEETSNGSTSDHIIAVMRDGAEWSPSAIRRHLMKLGVRKSYKSIHSALSRLLSNGLIEKTERGWYRLKSSRPTHGVGKFDASPMGSASPTDGFGAQSKTWLSNIGSPGPPRIHDVWLVAEGVPVRKSIKLKMKAGDVELTIIAGVKRGKVTVIIKNDYPGLDYNAFSLALELTKLVLERELNWFDDSKLLVKNVEFNIDVQNVRLDGLKSLTLKSFDDWFARLYQKRESEARVEVRQTELPIAQVSAILQGGFTGAQALTYIASLHSKFSEVAELMRFMMEQQKLMLSVQRELLRRFGVIQ